jgi:3HB-oligomer hydrolase 3HBOH
LSAVTTTGRIKKPLITVAGTMDGLLPIKDQARAYEDAVNDSRKGNNDQRNAQFRLYEVQNGNHIEAYALPNAFPELRVIQPYAQQAFDLLVAHVEKNAALPPSQCIPLDAPSIATNPAQPGNCASLYVAP